MLELIKKCNYCKREMPDNCIYMKHPKHGIVCQFCEPFKDGGVSVIEEDNAKEEDSKR